MKLITEDPQEIFAEAVRYFKAAPSQCRGKSGTVGGCMYLNSVGQRCVAGHFMVAETSTDEHTLRTFFGSVYNINESVYFTDKEGALGLLNLLQHVHDSQTHWQEWGSGPLNQSGWAALRDVGMNYGFDTSEIPA